MLDCSGCLDQWWAIAQTYSVIGGFNCICSAQFISLIVHHKYAILEKYIEHGQWGTAWIVGVTYSLVSTHFCAYHCSVLSLALKNLHLLVSLSLFVCSMAVTHFAPLFCVASHENNNTSLHRHWFFWVLVLYFLLHLLRPALVFLRYGSSCKEVIGGCDLYAVIDCLPGSDFLLCMSIF